MAIKYYTEDCNYRLEVKRAIREWLHAVAADEGYRIEEINYVFCSAQHLLEMNRQFLGHDYFTDIITFDYSTRTRVNGDIFISLDTVQSNAEQVGASFTHELHRIIIHGLLHLTGQADKTPETKAQMTAKEEDALAKITIEI